MGDEYIAKTGYWNSETDSTQHRHSPKLSEWICNFLKDKKRKGGREGGREVSDITRKQPNLLLV